VLEATLPFESQVGSVLIDTSAKGGARIVKAALPEDLDGCDVFLLVPDFNSVEKVAKIIHVRTLPTHSRAWLWRLQLPMRLTHVLSRCFAKKASTKRRSRS
jgi:hypothetical protein